MSRDTALINAYKEGKDLYAIIATKVYNNTYWDNMEHHEDGSPNPDGKKRRKKCKTLLLAITYGMGMSTIAEMLGCTYDEAKKLVDDFYAGFPTIKQWMDKLQQKCRETGYVEDLWGRRRRLPDIQKPKFEVIDKSTGNKKAFNPLIGSTGITLVSNSAKVKKYTDLFAEVKNKNDAERIKKMAEAEGLLIQEWTGSIAKAERQCVNASIQGSAATLTKMAMIKIHNDPILKKLGFKLAIAVHDELIGECPKENAEEAADRLCKLMIEAAAKDIEAPFKCDPTITINWYEDELTTDILREIEALEETEGVDSATAERRVLEEHSELTAERFAELLESYCSYKINEIK